MKKLAILLISFALTLTTTAVEVKADSKAKPTRWFEVEVILFTRDIPHDSIREEFEQQVEPITYRRTRDLLTKFHYPDIKNLFYQLGGCSIEDAMHYELERKYNALPSLAELEMRFADDPLASAAAKFSEQPIESIDVGYDVETEQNSQIETIDIEWFYQSFTPVNVTTKPIQEPNTCGETIDFTNWYKGLTYQIKPRHANRSFEYHYDMYPRVIISGERKHNNYVHLMSPANFKLREIYRTLRRQPDIRPILHTSWRQPAGAQSRSRATRLYAGYDFSERFDFQGNPRPPEFDLIKQPSITDIQISDTEDTGVSILPPSRESVVDNIENILAKINQGATVDYKNHLVKNNLEAKQTEQSLIYEQQVREIDGLFRIYIDNFNYLHIVADFNVRKEIEDQTKASETGLASLTASTNGMLAKMSTSSDSLQTKPTTNTRLVNYRFNQTRRVISKQLHYFDHPYMGMIVQIRRHGW